MASSQVRDRTRVPCTGRRIPTHWTTREIRPYSSFRKPTVAVGGAQTDQSGQEWGQGSTAPDMALRDLVSDTEGQEGEYVKEDPQVPGLGN